MTAIFLALAVSLPLICIIAPLMRAQSESEKRKIAEFFNHHQLRWVRRSYPELQNLNYREIIARYQVTDAYQKISIRDL